MDEGGKGLGQEYFVMNEVGKNFSQGLIDPVQSTKMLTHFQQGRKIKGSSYLGVLLRLKVKMFYHY